MKLALVNPSSNKQRKPVLPMSLLALGAVLEEKHGYRILDGNLEPDLAGRLDSLVRDEDVALVALTVMPGPQLEQAVPLSRELKQRHPQVKIVWGGYFPTQHYETCLRESYVDFVLRGHAELGFAALVDALERDAFDELQAIDGLAYRDGRGAMRARPVAAIPSPDLLPDYPYHRLPMQRYVRPTFMGERTLPHHSSYGCPFTCSFCAVVNMVEGRWLAQSAERTARVVRGLVHQWNLDAVELYDNNFFVDEARSLEFAERIRDLSIGWWGEARIDTMLRFSKRSWRRLRDSGLRMVFLGAESGSDEVLQRMNKGGSASTEKTLAIARRMAEFDVVPEFSFVLGGPPEPERDAEQTMQFIRKLKTANPRSEIVLYMYTPVPLDGELYERATARGFRFPEALDEWVSPQWLEFAGRRSLRMPWLDETLRRKVWDFERVLNAYYPTTTDARLKGFNRLALRAASAWRYHLQLYRYPFELRALAKLFAYQRPETSGF